MIFENYINFHGLLYVFCLKRCKIFIQFVLKHKARCWCKRFSNTKNCRLFPNYQRCFVESEFRIFVNLEPWIFHFFFALTRFCSSIHKHTPTLGKTWGFTFLRSSSSVRKCIVNWIWKQKYKWEIRKGEVLNVKIQKSAMFLANFSALAGTFFHFYLSGKSYPNRITRELSGWGLKALTNNSILSV